VKRLSDQAKRKQIAAALESGRLAGNGAETIVVRSLPDSPLKQYERGRLNEIAASMKVTPAEALLRLFESSRSSPVGIYFSLDEQDMQFALKQPWVAVCSDSGAVVAAMAGEGAHPRAYGTFPRILGHYVRDLKLMTLEEAVRKMTSLAASRAGLTGRGAIRAGAKADLVVFDRAGIRDLSTYEDPHHFSEGIDAVVINGKTVLERGKMTGELPGRVLRSADRTIMEK
jgi:N-acyl-D-aspartate/D-glutamate deacylase